MSATAEQAWSQLFSAPNLVRTAHLPPELQRRVIADGAVAWNGVAVALEEDVIEQLAIGRHFPDTDPALGASSPLMISPAGVRPFQTNVVAIALSPFSLDYLAPTGMPVVALSICRSSK